jgi:hypothetical protein
MSVLREIAVQPVRYLYVSGNDEARAFIENPCPLELCHEGTGYYPTLHARMMPFTMI